MNNNCPTDLPYREPNHNDKWGVIVNPTAGKRRLRKEWINIYRTLKRAAIYFSVQSTEYQGHATILARQLVQNGFSKILIIGGDGTVNEVVNGIFTSGTPDPSIVTIALIPYGTGNDWARYWGLNSMTRNQIIDTLYQRNTESVDVGLITFTHNNEKRQQYFINGAGFGFDGLVVNITNRLKRILGGYAWIYSLSVLSAVFRYRPTRMEITGGDKHIDDKIFSISVGNGCYSGGGLKQTNGNPTDGKLYIMAMHTPSFLKIIKGLGYLFRGEIYKFPLAETIESSEITIQTTHTTNIETDGVEINGDGIFHITVLHSAINMVVNKTNKSGRKTKALFELQKSE